MINPKYKDRQGCKWAVIAVLHTEDIKHHPERISLLQYYEDRYNWQGLEFSLAIQKIRENGDGENRHYKTINIMSRMFQSLSPTHKGAYHFGISCLNSFRTASANNKHYE